MKIILLLSLGLCGLLSAQTSGPPATWKFAVSGDSRNCGDIVMPAIAARVRKNSAQFYWHLGDFRRISAIDEDMAPPLQLGLAAKPMTQGEYLTSAWPDFINHQLTPFGDLPVFLAIGNHETILPANRKAWLIQFADWLDASPIRNQRLKDDPQDHTLRPYYHWVHRGVDFISLDNATSDQIDEAQMAWLRLIIQRDQASADIHTVVVGMHEALPGSIGHVHSMSDSPQGDKSGRQVYEMLWQAHSTAHKRVYILASHSHFFMENVFETADWKGKVLPGWIVGTAGAVRYRLPPETGPAQHAQTDVYGFLLGTVAADGAISFAFEKLALEDLTAANVDNYPEPLVRWCFTQNKDHQSLH